LVEQRTENPCVGGSIPPQATIVSFKQWSIHPMRLFSMRVSLLLGAFGDPS